MNISLKFTLSVLPEPTMTGVLERLQEIEKTSRQTFDELTRMTVFGQQKRQLQVNLLFDLHETTLLTYDIVGRVLRNRDEIIAELSRQRRLLIAEQIVVDQSFDLCRVEREAVRADRAQLLNVVFGSLEQESGLNDALQVTIGSQLETLLLGPYLYFAQATIELLAPVAAAQTSAALILDKSIE